MATAKRVSLVVTAHEYAALQWVARQQQLQRYPHGTARPKRPGRGLVLRKISLEEAVRRYDARPRNGEELRGDEPTAGLPSTAAAGHRGE